MPTNASNFYFDVNFGSANDGVFTLIDSVSGNPPLPPIEGYFLLTDNTPFLLTDGSNLLLA